MDIKNKEALIAEIEQFKEEALKMHIVQVLADTYERSSLFDHNINADGSVIWFKTQARQLWDFWQAAKAQVVPEWISVEDRMPEEGEEVWVHHYGHIVQATKDKKYSGGFKQRNCRGWESVSCYISHWMSMSIKLPEIYNFYYEHDAKVAQEKAIIEAQEPAPLKLGDLVEPIDHRYTLASGCERYPYAYVVNTNPFQLMSEEGDMYWCCTVEAGGYKLIKSNDQLPEAVSLRMIREGLLAPVEAQEQGHENG
jgi:hypothetical protein